MDSVLEKTIATWRKEPFIWGVSDCIMSVCNHILDVTGIDPAEPWRGTYDDQYGAIRIYEEHGGVLGLFSYGMAQAGFEGCDIAIGMPVVANVGGFELVGICTGKSVSFRMERGIFELRVKPLGVWQI